MGNSIRSCSVDDCGLPHYGRGFCSPHYKKWRKYGDPLASAKRVTRVCTYADCGRRHYGRGFCRMHYKRLLSHGDPSMGERKRNLCSVDGCEGAAHSRTWCTKHYAKWQQYGDVNARARGEVRDGKRICPRCKVDKPLNEYSGTGACKPCAAASKRADWVPVAISPPDVHCLLCGRRFTPDRSTDYLCSDACAQLRRRQMDAYYSLSNGTLAAKRKWAKAHPEVLALKEQRRRARKAGATSIAFTIEQLNARLAFFGHRCWICRAPFEHLDHVKPLAAGGPHILANLRPSCAACNLSKGAHWAGVEGVIALSA